MMKRGECRTRLEYKLSKKDREMDWDLPVWKGKAKRDDKSNMVLDE